MYTKILYRFILAILFLLSIGAWALSSTGAFWINISAGKAVTLVIGRGDLGIMWSDALSDRLLHFSRAAESPLLGLDQVGGHQAAGFRRGQAILYPNIDTRWVGFPLWLPTLAFTLLAYAHWRKSRIKVGTLTLKTDHQAETAVT